MIARSARIFRSRTSDARKIDRPHIKKTSLLHGFRLGLDRFRDALLRGKSVQLPGYIHFFAGESEQPACLAQIPRDAGAVRIKLRKIELSKGISFVRRPAPQSDGLRHVASDAFSRE